jgi:hypothetical protein
VRTGGFITAAALHTKHDLQGREDNAVTADKKHDERLHELTSMAKFQKKATGDRKNQELTPGGLGSVRAGIEIGGP